MDQDALFERISSDEEESEEEEIVHRGPQTPEESGTDVANTCMLLFLYCSACSCCVIIFISCEEFKFASG